MNNYMLLNYVLANKKKEELEAQEISVPSDFMTKALVYGIAAPTIPMLGYLMVDKEAKKLIALKATQDQQQEEEKPQEGSTTEGEETAETCTTSEHPSPVVNIKATNENGTSLDRVNFASIYGELGDDFKRLLKEKSFDFAISDVSGNANLFYPEDTDVTIVAFYEKQLVQQYFEKGTIPAAIEFKIDTTSGEISQGPIEDKPKTVSRKSGNSK